LLNKTKEQKKMVAGKQMENNLHLKK